MALDEEGIKYLKILCLKKYRDAIKEDCLWLEKHYFQKLLTYIRYNNYSETTVQTLHKVFKQRAEYWSEYLLQFCKQIGDDDSFGNNAERSQRLHGYLYSFKINKGQTSHYEKNLYDEVRNIFKKYQYAGFASNEAIQRYKDCMHWFRYSKLENEMIEYFVQHQIDYTAQKTFPDLVSPLGAPLRFDAYIEKEGQPLLFECQGEQHYKSIAFFGGDEQFRKQQLYDQLKREYCETHNIPLLYIKYTQNASSIIRRFLSEKSYKKLIFEYSDSHSQTKAKVEKVQNL